MKNSRLEIMGYKRGGDVMPPRSKKYFRSTKSDVNHFVLDHLDK